MKKLPWIAGVASILLVTSTQAQEPFPQPWPYPEDWSSVTVGWAGKVAAKGFYAVQVMDARRCGTSSQRGGCWPSPPTGPEDDVPQPIPEDWPSATAGWAGKVASKELYGVQVMTANPWPTVVDEMAPLGGEIELVEFSIPTADFRLHQVTSYDSFVGWTQQASCSRLVMNKEKYGALPGAYKDMIRAAVKRITLDRVEIGVTNPIANCKSAYCIDPFEEPTNDDLTGNAC